MTVEWCSTTLDLLKHTKEFNLYAQLMVLVNPKQPRGKQWDQAYEAANTSLAMLVKAADKSSKQADDIIDSLRKVSLPPKTSTTTEEG